MLSHFHTRTSKGFNSPTGLWCSTLILMQMLHRMTCPAISAFIFFHQKSFFKSAYILVLLGWIQYLESWPLARISSHKAASKGTQILSLFQYTSCSSSLNSGHLPSSTSSRISQILGHCCWALWIRSSRLYYTRSSFSIPFGRILSRRSSISWLSSGGMAFVIRLWQ